MSHAWLQGTVPELRQLFNTTRKRKGPSTSTTNPAKRFKTWTHTFVCLQDPEDNESPDAADRAKLLLAGLGEKKINLILHSGPEDFKAALMIEFPKLKAGGGFELLRIRPQSRELDLIPIPHGGYTVEYLKAVVQNAKVSVCPIQAALDISAVNPVSSLSAVS